MTALLEDSYATASDVPVRARLGLVRRGLAERAREAGFIGSALEPAQELRAGAVLVLCGWPLFLIAGAVFGKFADNWWTGTPAVDRLPASASFNAVAVLGRAGLRRRCPGRAAWPCRPSSGSSGQGGWSTVRRPVPTRRPRLRACGPAPRRRAGLGPPPRARTIATAGWPCTAQPSSSSAWRPPSPFCWPPPQRWRWPAASTCRSAVLRGLGVMALVLSVVMTLLFAGFVTWWATQAASRSDRPVERHRKRRPVHLRHGAADVAGGRAPDGRWAWPSPWGAPSGSPVACAPTGPAT